MSTGKQLSALLLLTTALTFPAGAAFAQDLMAISTERVNASRNQSYSVFVVFDFSGKANIHR